MQMELFKSLTGTEITHVPYKGAGPALNDVVAGPGAGDPRQPAVDAAVREAEPHGADRRRRAPSGWRCCPRCRPSRRSGWSRSTASPSTASTARRALPRDVVQKVNAAVRKALADPAVRRQDRGHRLARARQQPRAVRGADQGRVRDLQAARRHAQAAARVGPARPARRGSTLGRCQAAGPSPPSRAAPTPVPGRRRARARGGDRGAARRLPQARLLGPRRLRLAAALPLQLRRRADAARPGGRPARRAGARPAPAPRHAAAAARLGRGTLTDRGLSDDKLVCAERPPSEAERRAVLRFFAFYARCKALLNLWRGRPGRNACDGWIEAPAGARPRPSARRRLDRAAAGPLLRSALRFRLP